MGFDNQKNANTNDKKCAGCGKPDRLPIEGKFCSDSCKEVWWWRRRKGYHNPE